MNGVLAPSPNIGCGPLLQGHRDATLPLRQAVFEHVRACGRAARTDITDALDISAGSATTLTADLIASGFLQEVEHAPRDGARGRPRVALQVVCDAAFVIGVKLANKRHTAVLVDFAGNMVAEAGLDVADARCSLAQLLTEIEDLVLELLAASGKSRLDIKAIGIGLPGIVDYRTGIVAWSSLLESRDENVAAAVSSRIKIPVVVDNDANMLTLAELWFGEGRAMTDFAMVTIESGVGMGLVLDNQLYRGTQCMGLEIGHTKVHLDGALCQCGQRGCLEAYLGGYALVREAATALKDRYDPELPMENQLAFLHGRALSGDRVASAIFKRAGRYLSLGLSNVVQLFDPGLIILSGERLIYDYLDTDEVVAEMQNLILKEGRETCKVVVNAWDDLVWARGASALALFHATAVLVGGEARAA